jgi:uncharacterized membrane protein YhaH (DUF805 family)
MVTSAGPVPERRRIGAILLGEIGNGRLARLPFLAYTMLLMLIVIGAALLLGAGFGIAENMIGGEGAAAQAEIESLFAGPLLIVLALVGLGVLFVHYNLIAKRARDIGLPGWAAVALIVVVTGLAGAVFSESVAGVVNALTGLALLLVPSGALARASG